MKVRFSCLPRQNASALRRLLVFLTVPESIRLSPSLSAAESRLGAVLLAAHDMRVDARRGASELRARTPRDEATARLVLSANARERAVLLACGRAESASYRGDAEDASCWADLARALHLGEDVAVAWES